jgi:hypothetical protein
MEIVRRGIAAVLLGAAFSAHAVFVQHDSQFGADTLIEDSDTGLRWLRMDVTRGMSYNEVYEQLDTTFAGFALGGANDNVDTLFANMGLLHESQAQGVDQSAQIPSIRDNMLMFGAFSGSDGYLGLRGFQDYGGTWYPPGDDGQQTGTGGFLLQGTGAYVYGNTAAYYDDAGPFFKPERYATYGVFLVAPPVPEPSTYAGMLLGLGLLGAYLKRRSARAAK